MEVRNLIDVSSVIWITFLALTINHGSTIGVTDLILEKNDTCEKFQTEFALAAQDFIFCSVSKARPITFCENCVTSYLDVLTSHQDILTGVENGTQCRNHLINVDRLEIIETLFSNIQSLWTRGECNNCFEVNSNGSTTSNLNNSTKTFQLMNSVVRKCVQDNMPRDKPDICIICRDSYVKLNEFYNNLKKSASPSVYICMDIVDSMNASRMEWSKDLGCRDNPGLDIPFISSAIVMSVVPVVFYLSLWKFSNRLEHSRQQ